MQKITPCLWFNKEGLEAAKYYVSLFKKNSKILKVSRSPVDYPGGKKGDVLTVEFQLHGQRFMVLNGGSHNEYNNAISLSVDCKTQKEVDQLWAKILKSGGKAVACGWIKDKYGVPWQIVPSGFVKMWQDKDAKKAARAMEAMMKMVKLDINVLKRAYAGK